LEPSPDRKSGLSNCGGCGKLLKFTGTPVLG
jgi:hypothetical protein